MHLDNPWWAAISAWVISNPDKSALWQKGVMRILGTIAGCVLGYELSTQLEGRPMAQAICFFFLGAVAAYMRFRSRFGYAWLIGILAAILLMSLSLSAPQSLYYFAHYRAYEIICGVVSATLCDGILRLILRLEGAPTGNWSSKKTCIRRQPKGNPERRPRGRVNRRDHPDPLVVVQLAKPAPNSRYGAGPRKSRPEGDSLYRTQRILGCLLGGSIGLFASLFASESMFLWSAIFILGLAGFSRLHFSDSHWAYTGTQGGLAFIFAIVTGNGPPDTIVPVVGRITGILLGVFVFMSVAAIVQLCQTAHTSAVRVRDLS